jgi:hypothetical protein
VRFLKPVPCDALVDVKAWLILIRPPLYCVAAELLHEQQVMASAEAKFIRWPRAGSRTAEIRSGKHSREEQ